jgi:hypothetical protein
MAKRTKPPNETIVFLSSTFRDLASHRSVLKLALESSAYRVFGMELFTADESPPLDTCLGELNQSHIYVGVIGEYYGSCPPGFKKSYTQLEYERAIKRKMPMFLFLTADDAQVTPAQIERDAKKLERLNKFKSLLKKNHTVAFFKDANQAAWQILAALRKHELRESEKKGTK